MADNSNVLNHFHQPTGTSTGGVTDNPLELGGTVLQNDGTQAAAIIDVTGGVTVDAEARTAINALLAVMRNTGIIAP